MLDNYSSIFLLQFLFSLVVNRFFDRIDFENTDDESHQDGIKSTRNYESHVISNHKANENRYDESNYINMKSF